MIPDGSKVFLQTLTLEVCVPAEDICPLTPIQRLLLPVRGADARNVALGRIRQLNKRLKWSHYEKLTIKLCLTAF